MDRPVTRPARRRLAPAAVAAFIAAGIAAFAAISLDRLAAASSAPEPTTASAPTTTTAASAPAPAAAETFDAAAPPGGPAAIPPRAPAEKGDEFISYVEPGDFLVYQAARERAGVGATPAQVEAAADAFRRDWAADNYHGPEPAKSAVLYAREQAWLDATSPRPASPDAASSGATSAGPSSPDATSLGPTSPNPASPGATSLGAADASREPARPQALLAPAVTGTLKLFTVAVEFDGSDTAENFSHEVGIRAGGTCVTETVTYDGPMHNEIARPGPRDNATTWLPSFERDYYDKLIFSSEGFTERLRPDLVDPEDGRPGIDIRGHSMANYYREVSGGRVTFDGGPKGVVAWVKVPHSVGYYAANPCRPGSQPGSALAPRGSGLPANPRFPNGISSLVADIITSVNATDPDFPWVDYDSDGDRVIDHVIIFHAGIDESEGGGVDGNQQIWAHRGRVDARTGTVDNGGTTEILTDDLTIRGYTIQPENSNLGVLVHEFGHDLGLPDLYTTTGDEDVTWWDLMSVGARTGRLNGNDPTHMSTWSKTALGWGEPTVVNPIDDPEEYTLGQAALPPAGSLPALRVDLPPAIERFITLPAGSSQAWWSGDGQAWADHRLIRDLDLSGISEPVSLTFQIDHLLEQDADYLFVEVSVDGGQTYTQTKGFRVGTNAELTTPDDYADPNESLAAFGRLVHGYTGSSGGWRGVYHDLTPYAGQALKLRLHYVTDAGGQDRGAFVDKLQVLAGNREIWADPVEGDDIGGWTSTPGTFQGTSLADAGWTLSGGMRSYARYYLLEWRNAVNFDLGLKYTYNTIWAILTANGERELLVDWVRSNVPGLLVWVRDTRFGLNSPSNGILGNRNFLALPSEGAKGGLLVVDAHPEPLRGPLGGTFSNTFGSYPFPPDDNWRGRVQTTNSAFTLAPTDPVTLTVAAGPESPATTVLTATRYGALPAVAAFHDALGYTPGVELLPLPIMVLSDTTRQRIKRYAFVDADASVVVPAAGYYPPRTPAGFTGLGGETSPPSADVSSAETMFLRGAAPVFVPVYVDIGAGAGTNVSGEQTGNPGDAGVQFGFHFKLVDQASDGSTGTVRVWRQADAAEVSGSLAPSADGGWLEAGTGLHNTGGAYTLTLYSDFDELAAGLRDGSLSEGAIPVAVTPDAVVRAVLAGGEAGLAALAVPAKEAIAVAWAGKVGSGSDTAFTYQLAPYRKDALVKVTNSVYGAAVPLRLLDQKSMRQAIGSWVYLPVARRGE